VERIVQLDSFGDLGRIVTVSPLLFIVLDELPLPALTLSLGGLCKACSRPLVSWSLPGEPIGGAAVACGCTTAVCRPPWTAEALGAEHWPAVVSIRSQVERQAAPPEGN